MAAGEGALFAFVGGAGADDGFNRGEAVDVAAIGHLEQAGHGGGLDVEDAPGVAGGDGFPGDFVLPVEFFEVGFGVAVVFEVGEGIAEDAEARLAEEVEFEEAEFFDVVHGVVGGHDAFGGFKQGHAVRDGVAADDEAAGVHGEVAGDAVEGAGQGEDGFVGLLFVGEVAAFGDFVDGDFGVASEPGEVFGEAAGFAFGDAVDFGDIGDGGAALEGVDGADHGDVVAAVAVEDILNDFVAAVPGEVEVDVGEFGELHALAVEEAFKAEAEAEGADVGDAEEVADEAAGGAAPGQGGDALGGAPFDDVGEDEEVFGVADLFDDGHFAFQAFLDLGFGSGAVAAGEAGLEFGAEEGDGVVAGGIWGSGCRRVRSRSGSVRRCGRCWPSPGGGRRRSGRPLPRCASGGGRRGVWRGASG